jgi:hypothetical protein
MLKGKSTRKAIAATLLVVFATNTFGPTVAHALTSGPTAPEATSFEPIDTTDMVNLQTGDFTYNIPLIEVPSPEGGYPLSLSYHAGIQPNEDASWVGLGWTLNPGAITRSVNGYPDDWNNVTQTRRDYWQGGSTTTYNVGVTVGQAMGPVNISFGLSFSQDTYRGFGVGLDVGASMMISKNIGVGIHGGVSPYGDGYVGAGASVKLASIGAYDISTGVGVTTNFKSLEADAGVNLSDESSRTVLGISMSTASNKPSLTIGGLTSDISNSNAGKIQTKSNGFGIDIPITAVFSISLGYRYTRYWSDETATVPSFGSMYMNGVSLNSDKAFDTYSLLDYPTYNIVDYPDPAYVQGGAYPDFDNYSVSAQGVGGDFRPYLFQGYMVGQTKKNNSNQTLVQYFVPGASNPSTGPVPHANPKFRFINDFSNQFRQSTSDFSSITALKTTAPSFDGSPVHGNNDGNYGGNGTDNTLAGSRHIQYVLYNQIMDGVTFSGNGFIKPNNVYGLSFPYVGSADPMYNQIAGFSITNESGVTYHYGLPVYSYNEYVYTEKIDKSAGEGASGNWNRLTKPQKYAYTWFLTSITGPDFVDRNGNNKADDGDWGYWINFEYGKWTDAYYWRNPSEGFQRDLDNEFQECSKGVKEIYYLNAIHTRTHTAIFEKVIRNDAKSETPSVISDFNPEPSGSFDWNSVSTLALNKIYLFTNENATGILPSNANPYTTNGHHGENIIDIQDISQSTKNNSLRQIDFFYDYSLCPNTANSFDYSYINTKYGKLTLRLVSFKGRGGACVLPPLKFQYELSDNEKRTGTVTIYNDISNFEGTIAGSSSYLEGDILNFVYNGGSYYCVVKKIISAGTYKVRYIDYIPPGNIYVVASATKNPSYNKDAYDLWGMYKSDFDANLAFGPPGNSSIGNENAARMTSAVSSKSVDAWSLRSVVSFTGATINIEYESDTYKKAVLNGDDYSFVAGNIQPVSGYPNRKKITIQDADYGINLNDFYTVGNPMQFMTLLRSFDANSILATLYPYCGWNYLSFSHVVYDTKNSSNATNVIEIGSNYLIVENPDFGSWFSTPVTVHNTSGQLISTSCGTNNVPTVANLAVANRPVLFGGGIRVKKLSIKSDNITNSTNYSYNDLGSSAVSSGVTSYEPYVLNRTYIFNSNSSTQTEGIKIYRKKLYEIINYLLTISREVPPPGVMYEYTTIQNEVTNSGEQPRQLENKTVYQFEVFRDNMVGRADINPRGSSGNNSTHNFALKNFTTELGNIKRVITYGLKSPGSSEYVKLSETVNSYLHDDISNQQFSSFAPAYEQKLSQYNSQGVIKERFVEVKDARNFLDLSNSTMYTKGTLNTREEFPSILTSQTSIDYKTGLKTSTQNLAFDFYSGSVTKQLNKDEYGNRFLTEIVPAYVVKNPSGQLVYPSMGLKVNNYLNKNMLTQNAETRVYKVDENNSAIGLVSANIQTWSNDVNVLSSDNSIITQNNDFSTPAIGNVLRPKMFYAWMPEGSTTDGITSIGLFVDFDWSNQYNPSAQNASWKKTSENSLYNIFSNVLEASDLNGNFAATKLGYNQAKILFTGAPAKFAELAYSGAEDNPVSNYFNYDIALGSGIVITNNSISHTGDKCIRLSNTQTGFYYDVPLNKLIQGKDYYASVWAKSTVSGVPSNAGLYYSINGGSPVYVSNFAGSSSNGWQLINIKIPGSAISGTGSLRVSCYNNHGADVYFDDFRFHPLAASVTSYVYDNQTGELTYILDDNNIFSKFEYDAVGRLTKTYRETIGSIGVRQVNEYVYNYGRPAAAFGSAAINNQTYYNNNCPPGMQPGVYPVTVPEGQFTSCISQAGADLQAQNYAQNQANLYGSCSSEIYARIEAVPTGYYYDGCYFYDYYDVFIRFYSDPGGTIPVSVSGLDVNYFDSFGYLYTAYGCTGTQYYLGNYDLDGGDCYNGNYSYYFYTTSGSGYTPI